MRPLSPADIHDAGRRGSSLKRRDNQPEACVGAGWPELGSGAIPESLALTTSAVGRGCSGPGMLLDYSLYVPLVERDQEIHSRRSVPISLSQ